VDSDRESADDADFADFLYQICVICEICEFLFPDLCRQCFQRHFRDKSKPRLPRFQGKEAAPDEPERLT